MVKIVINFNKREIEKMIDKLNYRDKIEILEKLAIKTRKKRWEKLISKIRDKAKRKPISDEDITKLCEKIRNRIYEKKIKGSSWHKHLYKCPPW